MITKISKILLLCPLLLYTSCLGKGGKTVVANPVIDARPSPVETNGDANQASVAFITQEYKNQIGLGLMNAAYAYGYIKVHRGAPYNGGNQELVAVIDTGITYNQPKLVGHIYDSRQDIQITDNISNYSDEADLEGKYNAIDNDGHGTAVASIIAGTKDDTSKNPYDFYGVAFNAKILPVKLLNGETSNDISDFSRALSYAVKKGSQVVNISLGSDYSVNSYNFFNTAIQPIIKNNNVAIVMAAGNDYLTNPINAANPIYPAAIAGSINTDSNKGTVMAVVAVDNNGNIASYSNRCGSARAYCLAAFGGDRNAGVYIALNNSVNGQAQYGEGYGTSFAAPFVSGAYAVLLSAWPKLTVQQATKILLTTSTPEYDPVMDSSITNKRQPRGNPTNNDISYLSAVYGWGLLNLGAAMQPIGQLAVTGNINNRNVTLDNTGLVLSPVFSNNLASVKALSQVMALDDYNRDYYVDLTKSISTARNTKTLSNILESDKMNSIYFNNGTKASNLSFGIANNSNHNLMSSRNSTSSPFNYNIANGRSFLVRDATSYTERNYYNTNNLQYIAFQAATSANTEFSLSSGASKNTLSLFAQNSSSVPSINTSSVSNNPYLGFISNNSAVFSAYEKNFLFKQITLRTSFVNGKSSNSGAIAGDTKGISNAFESEILLKAKDSSLYSITMGKLNEQQNMLGSSGSGAFNLGNGAGTNYISIQGMKNIFGSNYLIGTVMQGVTAMNSQNNSVFNRFTNIISRQISFGMVNNNVFGGKLSLVYMEPLRVVSGSASMSIPQSISMDNSITSEDVRISLKPYVKERNIELSYSIIKNNVSSVGFNVIKKLDVGNAETTYNELAILLRYSTTL